MRISIVTETYWPDVNGVAMTLQRLADGLCDQGHEVHLICTSNPERSEKDTGRLSSYREVRGFPVPGYKEVKFGWLAGSFLKQTWTACRPDVIYVATEGPLGWSAATIANRLGIAVTSGFHTNFHSYSSAYSVGFLQKIIERYLVAMHNKTHCTIVPTDEQARMLQTMGIPSVAVMGRGVDTSLFNPGRRSAALRQSWGVADDDPVMIYVGRIAEEKNLDLTMQTYALLKKHWPALKFVMVGEGPSRKRLEADYPDVIFAGRRTGEELASHYASGDIFAFTSTTETFGNVILEAMASGLAVVAYDYAAARLHIRRGINGLMAPFNDDRAFLSEASRLVEVEGLIGTLRIHASEHACHHSWQSIVQVFEQVLDDARMATMNGVDSPA